MINKLLGIFSPTIGLFAVCAALSACGGSGGSSPATTVAAASGGLPGGTVPATEPLVLRQDGAIKPDNMPGEVKRSSSRLNRNAPQSTAIVLEPVAKQQLESLRQNARRKDVLAPKAFQIGIPRDLTALARESAMASALRWYATSNKGSVAAITISSPGAHQIRLGILVQQLPPQAVLRVYSPGLPIQHEISAQEVLSTLTANRDAGDFSQDARTYWTPPTSGETVTLEIELPAGASQDQVVISIPRLSHIFAKVELESPKGLADSSYCSQDITCTGSVYDEESASVALLTFVKSGGTYTCTGTLMAASDNLFTPYMLTANHCISTQTVASTLVSTFFFRSTGCNIYNKSRPTIEVRGGATLLYNTVLTDTTFVRLNSAAPAGTKFSGWSVTPPAMNSATLGVHHPSGDLQAYATGSISGYLTCDNSSVNGSFSCADSTESKSQYYDVTSKFGITESGSSGSGIWSTQNGKRYLVGQLRGGDSFCTDSFGGAYRGIGTPKFGGYDTYGRFDLAYTAALSRWLSSAVATPVVPRAPVYRFYNATTGAHFYTQSTGERDFVIASVPSFKYENIAFYAYAVPIASQATPVYRFYNARTQAHFYTHSEGERNYVQTSLKDFAYEGPTWNAQSAVGGQALPVYRFYNAKRGTHFYTISEGEKNYVVSSLPDFKLDGVAYYAWTTQ